MGDEVDYWKEPEFDESEVKATFIEKSEFSIMVPDYRVKYLQQIWPLIMELLVTKKLHAELDAVKKTINVSTTEKTRDPFVIIRGRDFMKLLARGVDFKNAARILAGDDGEQVTCEIIPINGLCRSKDVFVRRRQRLIGPDSSTLKAIELLTGCYVCVNGNTVSCIGPWKGIKKVRKLVLDTFSNIHPIYALKTLMIQRELSKKEDMKDKNWDHYIPHFKKNSGRRHKPTGSKRQAGPNKGSGGKNMGGRLKAAAKSSMKKRAGGVSSGEKKF